MKNPFLHKKLMASILTLGLLLVIAPAWVEGAAAEDSWLKVGLLYNTTAPQQIRIESESGFLLMREEQGQLTEIRSLEGYPALDVSIEGTSVILQDLQGVLLSNDLPSDSVLLSASPDPESRIVLIGGKACRDGVRFLPDPSGGLTVINQVLLEQYLRGVLSKEMSPLYPIEALKAQAVTARSFAMANPDKHSAYGFDLCAGTCCQVYNGIEGEYAQTDLACGETRGEILAYKGAVVAGYYFAYSGGYTQNSEDVWSSALGYLRAVSDAFAPEYIWTGQLTFGEIRSKLESAGYDPGVVLSVRVASRLENGSADGLIIEGSHSIVTLQKESIRTILGSQTIRSTRFSIGPREAPPIITASASGRLILQSAGATESAPEIISVLSAGGVAQAVKASSLMIFDGTDTVEALNLMEKDFTFTQETVTGGTVYFKGMGFGHRVGMPQTSAKEMANQGYGYLDILRYYYTDIQILQASELSE